MKDQEIDNALAKELGWVEISSWIDTSSEYPVEEWCGWEVSSNGDMSWRPIPKFSSDLNLCAILEAKVLKSETDRYLYLHRLKKEVGEFAILANARDRSRILLKIAIENRRNS